MNAVLLALSTLLIVVGAIAMVVLGVGFLVNETPWLAAASAIGGMSLIAIAFAIRARVRRTALASAAAARARAAWAMVDRTLPTDCASEPELSLASTSSNLTGAVGMILLVVAGFALLATVLPKDPDIPWSPTSIIVTVITGVPGWLLLRSARSGAKAVDFHERRSRLQSVASRLDAQVKDAIVRVATSLPRHQKARLLILLDYGHLIIEPWEAGIACSECGVEGPVRLTTFVKPNPEAVIVSVAGMRDVLQLTNYLCRPCIERLAKEFGAAGGGSHSAQMLANNAAELFHSRDLPPPPDGARAPRLSAEVIERLAPARDAIIARIESRIPVIQVYQKTAAETGCTPGEVALFVSALANSGRTEE